MAKKSTGKKRARRSKAPASGKSPSSLDGGRPGKPAASSTAASAWPFALGLIFLLWAAAMSLLLVIDHIGGLALLGCGEGGPCEQAANSIWGKVPVVEWPVSFLGLAYFLGALAAWLAARGGLPTAFRYLVRLGALGSLFLCAIIVVEWLFCSYCIAAHIGNFAFWITMELVKARTRRTGTTLVGFAAVFVLASLGTGVWDHYQHAKVAEKAESERSESVQKMIEDAHGPRQTQESTPREPTTSESPAQEPTTEESGSTGPAVERTPAQEPATQESPPVESTTQAVATPAEETQPLFTGRYRLGPEQAPIRIVMITDYQCRDCRRIENEVMGIVKGRDDISLSIKYFPFNPNCNPHASRNMHPNACWAARAAEAAGILYGDEGFFKMHVWLFARSGVFTSTQELLDGIRELGYDPAGFIAVMSGDETLAHVRADCEEAKRLGLFFTPMTFINGVELRGWNAPRAATRTIAELTAANLPPRTAADDRPPLALEKYVRDWQDWKPPYHQREFTMPADARAWSLGPEEARIEIILWGDYQEEGTALADGVIRAFVTGRDDACYTFRHYPFNSDCNPKMPYQRHPLACWASRAAEAAGQLAGNDGYWRMHAWLMENNATALQATADELGIDADELRKALYTMSEEKRQEAAAKLGLDAADVLNTMRQTADQALRSAAAEMGFDVDEFYAALELDQGQANILDDIEAGKRLPQLRHGTRPGLHGIPTIFINNRYVPRWRMEGNPVLEKILSAAAEE
ncbi:MAG: thioredoxin domain-containing protein [Phycisphaerae bacterium]|nr:thioredoxin domain-containing protein [Phycisphaerae bacterium]